MDKTFETGARGGGLAMNSTHLFFQVNDTFWRVPLEGGEPSTTS